MEVNFFDDSDYLLDFVESTLANVGVRSKDLHSCKNSIPFATEMKETKLNEEDILVSFDVSSLFTNVPLDETITILAKKAFTENWFNETYDLNIKESDLVTLLQFATKDQLFQFEGILYQQMDGVAMGSPLGPLVANAFLCSLEKKLERDNKLPYLYIKDM